MCGGPWYGGGRLISAKTMKQMECTTVDVAAPVAFSFSHALYAAGMLKTKRLCHFNGLHSDFWRQWGNEQESFWKEVEKEGVTLQALQERAAQFTGVTLGTWMHNHRYMLFNSPLRICRDLKDTMMVLSRVNGRLFIPNQDPDYSWRMLLNGIFYLRDKRLSGVPITDPVWPQDLIKAERQNL